MNSSFLMSHLLSSRRRARLSLALLGARWVLLLAIISIWVSAASAQTFTPPAPPDVAPLIGETYSNDADRNRLDDQLESKVKASVASLRAAVTLEEKKESQALLDGMVDVELVFKEQITQRQIDDFLGLGGAITYIYKAVSYGWNGRIPLGKVETIPALMGATLVLVEEPRLMALHLQTATQNGRVRPIWASGFAGSVSGYDGDNTITIAIVDTGVDESHTDLSGRRVYWQDFSDDNELNPIDVIQHGSHVTGIALGTGQSAGAVTGIFYYTDSGDLTGVSSGYFYASPLEIPPASVTLTSTASWVGGGSGSLYDLYRNNGSTGSYYALSSASSGPSPLSESNSFTALATRQYSAALLSNGSMSSYAIGNSVTNYQAVGDGFNRFRGVAPGCQWAGAKVFRNSGTGYTTWTGAAIDNLVANRQTYNIKVMNLSLGTVGDPGLSPSNRQKVNTAVNNGIVIVVSAGNDGRKSTVGQREIDDPGRAAMALTVAAANDINELTDYSSHGFSSPGSTSGQEEDYKPDVVTPGGSAYYSNIMSVDSNSADAGNSSFTDVRSNDYYNIKGTSMASPFAAGCVALVIDALQHEGVTWDFSSAQHSKLVKMLLCATASETNANREVSFGYNPTLQRALTGPDGYPMGKDKYEGYGLINPDAAIEAVALTYTLGTTQNTALGSGVSDKRIWARKLNLTADVSFEPTLTNPAGGDFDLYLYSGTPSSYGTPVILASSTTSGVGGTESFSYTPSASQEAYLVVKCVSGAGTFSITSFITELGITVTSNQWTIGPVFLEDVITSGPFIVENDGNVPEDFTIWGDDSTANGWSLASDIATDAFKVEVDKGFDDSYEIILSTSEQDFATNVPAAATETFGLRYSAPNEDTKGGGIAQDFTITITASRYVP